MIHGKEDGEVYLTREERLLGIGLVRQMTVVDPDRTVCATHFAQTSDQHGDSPIRRDFNFLRRIPGEYWAIELIPVHLVRLFRRELAVRKCDLRLALGRVIE